MCVVQALLALVFISSLRQLGTSQLFGGCVCNMHSVLCSMLLVFLFLFSKFLAFSSTILVSTFLVFQCFLLFLKKNPFRCCLFCSSTLSLPIPELFSTRRVVRLAEETWTPEEASSQIYVSVSDREALCPWTACHKQSNVEGIASRGAPIFQ